VTRHQLGERTLHRGDVQPPAQSFRNRQVVGPALGFQAVEKPEALLGERGGQHADLFVEPRVFEPSPLMRTGVIGDRTGTVVSAETSSIAPAKLATVGDSNTMRRGSSRPRASRRRETSCVASSEWPPTGNAMMRRRRSESLQIWRPRALDRIGS